MTSSLLFLGTHLGLDLLEGERHVSDPVLKPWLTCVGKWVSSLDIWVSSSLALVFLQQSLSSSKSIFCLEYFWVKTEHLEKGESSCLGDEAAALYCVWKFESVLAGMRSWLSFSTHTTGWRMKLPCLVKRGDVWDWESETDLKSSGVLLMTVCLSEVLS